MHFNFHEYKDFIGDMTILGIQINNFLLPFIQDDMRYYPSTGDFVFKIVQNACKNAAGLPLSVQVIGRPYQEELVLHAMKELENQSKYKPERI